MKITESTMTALFVGVGIGWFAAAHYFSRGERLLCSLERVRKGILSEMETFADYCDITPAQRKLILGTLTGSNRVAQLEEYIECYAWALKKKIDPIPGSALALLCEKFLGLSRAHAHWALKQAKRPEDYRHLLASNKDTK